MGLWENKDPVGLKQWADAQGPANTGHFVNDQLLNAFVACL